MVDLGDVKRLCSLKRLPWFKSIEYKHRLHNSTPMHFFPSPLKLLNPIVFLQFLQRQLTLSIPLDQHRDGLSRVGVALNGSATIQTLAV